MKDPVGVAWVGKIFRGQGFYILCNHCLHTNDHLEPFGLMQCPSRDIVKNV